MQRMHALNSTFRSLTWREIEGVEDETLIDLQQAFAFASVRRTPNLITSPAKLFLIYARAIQALKIIGHTSVA